MYRQDEKTYCGQVVVVDVELYCAVSWARLLLKFSVGVRTKIFTHMHETRSLGARIGRYTLTVPLSNQATC